MYSTNECHLAMKTLNRTKRGNGYDEILKSHHTESIQRILVHSVALVGEGVP